LSESASDVELALAESPPYCAASDDVCNDASPDELSDTLPMLLAPSRNAIVPLGALPELDVTAVESVTGEPCTTVFADDVSVVVDGTIATLNVFDDDVLALLLPSPLYVAVNVFEPTLNADVMS
jgi:hypothetical protein